MAAYRDRRCHASVETIRAALVGNYREEHVFALAQALELYDVYQAKVAACDQRIEAMLERAARRQRAMPAATLPPARHQTRQPNARPSTSATALHAILGVDLTQIHGLGPYLALKLVGECGTDLSAWPSAKHFTSWLGLAPQQQDLRRQGAVVANAPLRQPGRGAAAAGGGDGRAHRYGAGRLLPPPVGARAARPRRSPPRPARSRVLFYNTLRHGMDYADPGASYYEERYRQRVLTNLRRRAKSLGYVLQVADPDRTRRGSFLGTARSPRSWA